MKSFFEFSSILLFLYGIVAYFGVIMLNREIATKAEKRPIGNIHVLFVAFFSGMGLLYSIFIDGNMYTVFAGCLLMGIVWHDMGKMKDNVSSTL